MTQDSWNEILVATELDAGTRPAGVERGWGADVAGSALKAISVDVLKASMTRFLDQMREILDAGSSVVGDFEVAQVEIRAQVSGDGQVSLMGSGMKVGVTGGLTFVLRRRPD